MNIIHTPGGEELVILSRPEYDALVTRAGEPTEAEEDAAAIRAHDAAQARLASGEDVMLPETVWEAVEGGASPVRVLREHRGLSQADLAARADVPQSYLSTIETRQKPGSAKALARLAAALAVPVSVLIGE